MKTNMSSNTLLGNRLQSIIESIHSLNVKEGDLSNIILPLLPSVRAQGRFGLKYNEFMFEEIKRLFREESLSNN